MKKIKIGIVCPEFPPYLYGTFHGGITTYSKNIAEGYLQNGCEVHVFTKGPAEPASSTVGEYTIHHIDTLSQPGGLAAAAKLLNEERALSRALLAEHARSPFALVEFIDWSTPGLSIVRRKDFVKIVKLHGPTAWVSQLNRQPLSRIGRFISFREKYIAAHCDYVFSSAEVLTKEMPRLWGVDIHPLFLPDPVMPSETFTPKQAGESIHLLNIGRLEQRKGQIYLIEAAARLTETNFHITFIGPDTQTGDDGSSYKEYLLRNIPASLADRIEFVDSIPHEKLNEYYAEADIVVVTTMDGNYGYATLEAMAAGCPVISTQEPGNHQSGYVEDGVTGRLVPPGDSDALADALRELLGDREKRGQIARNARQHILENFSARSIVEKVLSTCGVTAK